MIRTTLALIFCVIGVKATFDNGKDCVCQAMFRVTETGGGEWGCALENCPAPTGGRCRKVQVMVNQIAYIACMCGAGAPVDDPNCLCRGLHPVGGGVFKCEATNCTKTCAVNVPPADHTWIEVCDCK